MDRKRKRGLITPRMKTLIAADGEVSLRTVDRVYSGEGSEYSRVRVSKSAQRQGFPLPPEPESGNQAA